MTSKFACNNLSFEHSTGQHDGKSEVWESVGRWKIWLAGHSHAVYYKWTSPFDKMSLVNRWYTYSPFPIRELWLSGNLLLMWMTNVFSQVQAQAGNAFEDVLSWPSPWDGDAQSQSNDATHNNKPCVWDTRVKRVIVSAWRNMEEQCGWPWRLKTWLSWQGASRVA